MLYFEVLAGLINLLTDQVAKEQSMRRALEDELHQIKKQNSDLAKTDCRICSAEKCSKVLSCGHPFCANCAGRFYSSGKCPYCQQKPHGIQDIFLQ